MLRALPFMPRGIENAHCICCTSKTQLQSWSVPEWQVRDESLLLRLESEYLYESPRCERDVVVREHHTLWHPSCARGVDLREGAQTLERTR